MSPATRRTLSLGVLGRVDGMKRQRLSFMLDPGSFVYVDEATGYHDHAPGEKALVKLPVRTLKWQRGISSHPAAHAHSQRLAQLTLVEAVGGTFGGFVHTCRRAADQRCVRRFVVVLVEKGPKPHVDVV